MATRIGCGWLSRSETSNYDVAVEGDVPLLELSLEGNQFPCCKINWKKNSFSK